MQAPSTPGNAYGTAPMDISPESQTTYRNNFSYYNGEDDNDLPLLDPPYQAPRQQQPPPPPPRSMTESPPFSPILPGSGSSARNRSHYSPIPESNPENDFRFSPVPERPGFGQRLPPPPRQQEQQQQQQQEVRRTLVFRLTPPRQERGRNDEQRFTVSAVRGGVEDAIIDLATGPKRGRPFIVLRVPALEALESNQQTIQYRLFGNPRGAVLQFNVERALSGKFRGYKMDTRRDAPEALPPIDGIDNGDRTLFPIEYGPTGFPADKVVFSLVRANSGVWTLSSDATNERRSGLIVILVVPMSAVRIFDFL